MVDDVGDARYGPPMSAFSPAQWSEFALAQLGASAALLGLVFVGFSINLRDIVTDRQLVNRAGEAVVAARDRARRIDRRLIPGQSDTALAVELLVVAVITSGVVFWLQRGAVAEARLPASQTPRGTIPFRRGVGFGSLCCSRSRR